jgi:hypothetical protein
LLLTTTRIPAESPAFYLIDAKPVVAQDPVIG